MTVRVVRILEYVYPDHETAEKDMRNWNVPQNGSVRRGGGIGRVLGVRTQMSEYIITSATMTPRTVSPDEAVPLVDEPSLENAFCRRIVHISGADQMCGARLDQDGLCPQALQHIEGPGGH